MHYREFNSKFSFKYQSFKKNTDILDCEIDFIIEICLYLLVKKIYAIFSEINKDII